MTNKYIGSLADYPTVTPAGADTIPLIQGGALKQSTIAAAGAVSVATHVAESDPHTQYLTQARGDLLYAGSPAPTGNALSSGGGVAWLGDYDYRVSAANYTIQGTPYSSAQADLTLDASHATLDRIDIIALTTSGPVILKGTDSATPAAPDVNPSTHIALTFVYVAATSTAPTATREDVYLENTEWTSSSSGATWALASTNNPLSGTVDIEATAVAANGYVQLEKPSGTLNPSDYDNLVLYVRSKATWAAAKFLAVRLLNAGVQVGSAVTVKTGVFGFDSSVTSNYQQLVIPLAIFGAGSLAVNQIRFTVTGGGAAIGFYLDDVSLQAGVSLATPTDSLRYRGAYNASAQYQRFDVVYTGSGATLASWVALQPAVGITPAAGVYWDRLTPTGGSGTVTSVAASVPAFLSVAGSPVTTTGTLAISYSGTALPVANGGTGITAFGTGVATALGVNVGSAGAFVVQGGALGTPSSGTLTNATGLTVAGGGTGVATLTAYAPIFGGTTGTGAVQSGSVGTSGHVLTSNGAGALPTFQAPTGGGGVANGAHTADTQARQSKKYLMRDGTWRDPLVLGTGIISAGSTTTITNDSKYNAWPSIVRLHNSALLMAYTKCDEHTGAVNGIAIVRISTDEGATWGSEITAYSDALYETMGVTAATVISTGRVFLTLNRQNSPGDNELGLVYSDDNGATWSAWVGYSTAWTTIELTAGPIVELPDGDLLQTVEGSSTGSAINRSSHTLRSSDEGLTWGDEVTIRDYVTDTRPYYETCMALLDNGDLIAIHRNNDGSDATQYISKSTDNGATWGAPYAGFTGRGRPHVIQASTGTMFAVTRRSLQTWVYTSTDRGVTWDAGTQVDASSYTMQYGCPVEMIDGRILVVFGDQPTSSETNSDIKTLMVTETKVKAGLVVIPIACGDESTAATTGAGKVTFRMPCALILEPGAAGVRANAKTAPTGSTFVIDINEDTGGGATSILSTKLSIDASEKTSVTAATPPVISDRSLADDSEITIDFDQVGSTVAGAGIKVSLIGRVPA
jgi:hypothetical protein